MSTLLKGQVCIVWYYHYRMLCVLTSVTEAPSSAVRLSVGPTVAVIVPENRALTALFAL